MATSFERQTARAVRSRLLRDVGSALQFSGLKLKTIQIRVSEEQKSAIAADAKRLGVSASELLLHLHRVASPALNERGGR